MKVLVAVLSVVLIVMLIGLNIFVDKFHDLEGRVSQLEQKIEQYESAQEKPLKAEFSPEGGGRAY